MYRNSYQHGMLTVFFSSGSKPLNIWDTHTKDGYIKRFLDTEINTMVLEIRGNNISTTYISCPKGNQVLGIHMPFLVMIVKNLTKYFSFEVTVLDSTGTRRRFRVSNFQSTTQILPLCTVMPIGLAPGWNQIQFNLAEFTRRAYKNQFVEVQRLKINANIRLRRIYFTEKLMSDDELPAEYKLYFPLQQHQSPKVVKDLKSDKENITPIQDEVQGKRMSITDPSKSNLKSLPEDAMKISRKSLQDVSVPEEGLKIMSTGRIDEPIVSQEGRQVEESHKNLTSSQEKEPDDEKHIGEEQSVSDNKSIGETVLGVVDDENKSAGELDSKEHKSNESVNIEDQDDTGEDNKKPEEAQKGEGDKQTGDETDKGEDDKNLSDKVDKGEGDENHGE